ncbi:MAG: hypothetical protein IJS57_04920 [Paludibacteraceae bacterium]|nr:hypothetical protein [Paludibacteraceae bacterium]
MNKIKRRQEANNKRKREQEANNKIKRRQEANGQKKREQEAKNENYMPDYIRGNGKSSILAQFLHTRKRDDIPRNGQSLALRNSEHKTHKETY